jgi:hypothetical protein
MKLELALWVFVFILAALAFLFPKTRTISLSVIGVTILAIVTLVLIAKRTEPLTREPVAATTAVAQRPVDFEQFRIDKLDESDPEAKSRIRVKEIRFDQVRVEAGAERGSVGMIEARLYNDSASYTLTDYGYYLQVQDCIKAVCTTVFDQRGLASVSVPPNQARDVTIAVSGAGTRDAAPIKILGTANVLLIPIATRAEPVSSATTPAQKPLTPE